MDKTELLEYIRNKKCFCTFCYELKQKVLENGIEVLSEYDSWICPSIQDMLNAYSELTEDESYDPESHIWYSKGIKPIKCPKEGMKIWGQKPLTPKEI